MARASSKRKRKKAKGPGAIERTAGLIRRVIRWSLLGLAALAVVMVAWIGLYRFVNPPTGYYMWSESRRLGGVRQEWVSLDQMASAMPLSVVAAEDANFCRHWGFDMVAIRAALADGGARGASTLTQQVVKNTFLWHGRNLLRKGLEALITPLVEILWPKERILEVYLNMAEFDEGIFGVQAAAQRYFRVDAAALSSRQAALLATVLPDPQGRDAHRPSGFMTQRADAIQDGAATIARDDRSACFGG
ncbi:monofunctional biosynthetic peptidoglycan transglycosylase [Pararhodobacter sp. CCB-MM2]|uniref:monofunctional biosynthetic peptidoglycan transglycosylase n=1 Tax=Pararhodobacter sp. CCB-MM2 TaxID=1786003 RepID=UPI00082C8AC5|nr:monofunctional biosynthetic peptidoglycan transglycosylase [Pararhodobacter sp. CCB-MM2]MCA2014249.1 monofunctional biosynthetic peptidoglycan transglycosylase [Cereibacter sphaeroides]